MAVKKLPVFLIAAPIGDILSDFSLTALETLKRIEDVFMEDIHQEGPDLLPARLKRKGVLTDRHRIHLVLTGAGEASHFERVDELVRAKRPFAILADRGMPCFLDPGLELVRHLLEHHGDEIELVPVGASSALDAVIMVSGVDCTQFVFLGHFPDCRQLGRQIFSLDFPNIAYVRGDAWMDFVAWLKEIIGDDCRRGWLTACSNIRQFHNRRRTRISLSEPLEKFREFIAGPAGGGEKGPLANHVAILHWEPVKAIRRQERQDGKEKGYFYLYLNKVVCDASCIFCSRAEPAFKERIRQEAERHDFQAELVAIRERIARCKDPQVFHIGGHEPAIYPTLLSIVQAAAARGFGRIVIETNGLALADAALVARLKEAGLHEARLPVYGVSAEVHDAVTGVPGSFDKLKRAEGLLRQAGIDVVIKTVVLRQNLGQLEELLSRYPQAGCSFVMPASDDAERYRRVCPRLGEIPESVASRMGNIHLPCLFPPRPDWRPPDPEKGGGWVVLEGGRLVYQGKSENLSPEQLVQRTVKPTRCRPCTAFNRCSGIYPLYLDIYGEDEFVPLC